MRFFHHIILVCHETNIGFIEFVWLSIPKLANLNDCHKNFRSSQTIQVFLYSTIFDEENE